MRGLVLGVPLALMLACSAYSTTHDIDDQGCCTPSGVGGSGVGGNIVGGTGQGARGGAGGITGGVGGGDDFFSPVCGDLHADVFEECDDGNYQPGDGCSANCRVERDWTCEQTGPCTGPLCGDGVVASSEACDDGNAATDDGCASCQVSAGWVCPVPGAACRQVCDGECGVACGGEAGAAGAAGVGGEANSPATVECRCGDGVLEGSEECDDGVMLNSGVYGGCDQNCNFAPFCGDGIVDALEQCDPGRAPVVYGENGCTATCLTAPFCGDGQVDGSFGEQCDDPPESVELRCSAGCVLQPVK